MQHQRPNHNNVSVAHFFDWSDQDKEERLSVSKLYREIAVGVGASGPRSMSEKVRPRGGATNGAGGRTPRVSPGRMFLRDKGMLTKGEREIIEGIYRNRGDLPRKEPAHILRSDFVVRSHRDAWLIGKDGDTGNKPSTELPRDPPRGALMEVMAQANHGSEYSSSRASDITRSDGQGHTTCVVCMQERQLLQQQQQQQQKPHHHPHASHKPHKKSQSPALPAESMLRPMNVYDGFRHRGGVCGAGESLPVAPPASPNFGTSPVNTERRGHNNDTVLSTSPSNATSTKLLPRRRAEATLTSRYEPEHLAQLTASRHELGYKGQSSVRYVANLPGRPDAGDKGGEPCSDGESNHESDGSRRKVQVKVYLPKVAPDPVDEDIRTCLLQGRPSLARERPLSHSDIRQEHKESGWNHQDEKQQQEGELGSHYDDTVTQGPDKEDLESEREDVVVHHNGEHEAKSV
ncbi:uncharacterized protein [Littorina saxatilis]|uniref:uncharacterized protein n=1 Tax=Littorina saxatilis TaxID=31220 RepID=UPI0038B63B14